MLHYASLSTVDFASTILPTTSTASSTLDSTVTAKWRKADITIGGSSTYLNCADGEYPHMCVQSIDNNAYGSAAQRSSLRSVVAVVSALDVMEALVFATQAYKQHTTPPVGSGNVYSGWSSVSVFADSGRCVEIVMMAVALLLPRLPAEFNTAGTNSSTNAANTDMSSATTTAPAQCVLVVEGLVHPTSPSATAMGKLQSALNSSSSGGASGGTTSGSVSIGVGRPLLPTVEAREVSANHLWLVQMFIAVVCMRGSGGSISSGSSTISVSGSGGVAGWQCFSTNGEEQTERFLYALIHETHRQSLMLY